MPPSELSWDDARLHETESKMTSAQKDQKEEDTSNYFPPQDSTITSEKDKEQDIPDDLPPQTDAIMSQGGTSFSNEKDEVEFETQMMIKGLPHKTIQMLKEIYMGQRNPSKHTSLETFVLDMSVVDDKARTERQHFLWLIGTHYKDVLWEKDKMEPWVVKAVEDVKSGDLVCPNKAAMDRANKVYKKMSCPFGGTQLSASVEFF